MHDIHHTDALILVARESDESSRMIVALTEMHGLVHAHARSAREERSKLRYGLQEFSFGRLALVQGRDVWRITGAHEQWSVYQKLQDDRASVALFARLCRLLMRLIAGEGRQPELFTLMRETAHWLARVPAPDERLAGERMIVLRMLYVLGYLDPAQHDALAGGIAHGETLFDPHALAYAYEHRHRLTEVINASLFETQL